ncbi:MAG: IPT/TIG domain-containing protein [Deltaproteobacteria bacterium]|nr:IPT/TIG domain-containing protein [Deltaproteobacteria bacterium]
MRSSIRDVTRRVPILALLAVAGGCTNLAPTEPTPRPTVEIRSPIPDVEVPFNTAFKLEVHAETTVGALLQLQVTLRGAASARRTIPLSGVAQTVDVDLTVPKDALVGPDHLPLDVVVVAEAAVDGRTVTSPAAGVTLRMVDRSAPTLTLSSPDALPDPPTGVDLAFPAGGGPVRLILQAEDPIGGVVLLALDLPEQLGGSRARTQPASRAGRLEVVLDAPAQGDFEVVGRAQDAALDPNQAVARYHLRVGAGGEDTTPPELTLVASATLACGGVGEVRATAVDPSGPERVVLTLAGGTRTAYGPDPAHPTRLSLTATVAGPRPGGRQVVVSARATDVFGWSASSAPAVLTSVDTEGPAMAATVSGPAVPGGVLTATVSAAEACGQLAAARLTVVDGAGTATVVQVGLQGASFAGQARFALPADLCALAEVDATLVAVDDSGLTSAPRRYVLPTRDPAGPLAVVTSLVPDGRARPGQLAPVQVELTDLASGVASATVTVEAVGVEGGPVRLSELSRAWPRPTCLGRVARRVDVPVLVPADLRLDPGAALRVTVRATDHAGARSVHAAFVPLLDDAPPLITFLEPAPGTVLAPGATATVTVAVRDVNHDVAELRLQVVGPGDVGGAQAVLRSIGAASATVSFALHVNATAPLGAALDVVALATDTASPAVSAQAILALGTCGAPTLSAVSPQVAPVGGDVPLTLTGAGWLPSRTRFSVAGVALEALVVRSATLAEAHLPAGAYPPGPTAVTVENVCGAQVAADVLQDGLRFVAPPTVLRLRPAAGAGTRPGALLPVAVGAQADGVALLEVGVQVAGGAPAVQPLAGSQGVLDAVLLVPASAPGPVAILAWAQDVLGQRTEVQDLLPLDGDQLTEVRLVLPRLAAALGETLPYAVEGRTRDDGRRSLTPTASVASDRPDLVQVLGPGRLRAVGAGSATLTVTQAGLQHQVTLQVLDGALYLAPEPLYLSPLTEPGAPAPAPARLVALRMAGGVTDDVSALVTWSVTPPDLAGVQGDLLTPARAGAGSLQANLPGLPVVSRPVSISATLDVAAGEAGEVPSGQRFSGGLVAGTARAQAPATGPWRLRVDGALVIGPGGRLDLAGAPGWAGGSGGRAAPARAAAAAPRPGSEIRGGLASGAGGGPAGGASGGGGGGRGGRRQRRARWASPPQPAAQAASSTRWAGAGPPAPRVVAAAAGRAELLLAGATLTLEGELDLAGGPGSAATSTTAGAGGGGGGRLRLEAAVLIGAGRVRVSGGPGGDGATGGGGGGGGAVELVITGAASPFVDVDRAGGAAGVETAGQVAASAGTAGAVTR